SSSVRLYIIFGSYFFLPSICISLLVFICSDNQEACRVMQHTLKYTGSYVPVTSLEVGTAYWLNHLAGSASFLTYTWSTSGTALNYAPIKPLKGVAGWNMIGSYEFDQAVDFIRTMPENSRSSASVFKYTPGGGYSAVTVLVPGRGYWINLTTAADIYLPGSFAGTLAKDPLAEITKDWGRIIINDAAGQNYTLYSVTDASVDMNRFELPPLPPAGLFDVRFASQRFAEDLRTGNQLIKLTGVVYPVTISAVGINIKLEDAANGSEISAVVKEGNSYVLSNSSINVLKVSSQEGVIPSEYALEQNYPNPFNPTTTIKFSLPEVSAVKLTIYNALGQKVTELVNSTLDAGQHSYNWDASKVASGLYFYELNTSNFTSVKKMMLLK
ncbi:MAG: T9SS type A sorting domain-containing protein, partial [Ignavibacteriaceae bacterium]